MSWLFGTNYEVRKILAKEEAPTKRGVLDCPRTGGYYGHQFLDPQLREYLLEAGLMRDAEEVIACLNDSPRFKKHLCAEAERKVAEKKKELEALEEQARKACRIAE